MTTYLILISISTPVILYLIITILFLVFNLSKRRNLYRYALRQDISDIFFDSRDITVIFQEITLFLSTFDQILKHSIPFSKERMLHFCHYYSYFANLYLVALPSPNLLRYPFFTKEFISRKVLVLPKLTTSFILLVVSFPD